MGTIAESTIKAGTVLNTDLAAGAGVTASKLKHQDHKGTDLGFDTSDTPTTETRRIFVAQGAAELMSFQAMLADTGSSTDIDFDLHVNGSTVLSAVVNLTNSDSNNTATSGTVSSGTLTSGDYVDVVMTVTSATGAQGPWVDVYIDRDYV